MRALRTGNSADPSNGFLLDLDRPSLVADFDATILDVGGAGTIRTLTYRLEADYCNSIEPKIGDVIFANDALMTVFGGAGSLKLLLQRRNLLAGCTGPRG